MQLRVRADARPPTERAEAKRLEMAERFVRAFDGEHGVPALEAVALVERVHGERAPVVGAQLEQRDRFVDPAHPAFVLAGELHQDVRATRRPGARFRVRGRSTRP